MADFKRTMWRNYIKEFKRKGEKEGLVSFFFFHCFEFLPALPIGHATLQHPKALQKTIKCFDVLGLGLIVFRQDPAQPSLRLASFARFPGTHVRAHKSI